MCQKEIRLKTTINVVALFSLLVASGCANQNVPGQEAQDAYPIALVIVSPSYQGQLDSDASVLIDLSIRDSGRVRQATVLEIDGIDTSAVPEIEMAFNRWTFKPLLKKGIPVSSEWIVKYNIYQDGPYLKFEVDPNET